MFCSECGAKNPDDAAFCSECGKKLEKPQESASVTENNTTQNVQYQKVEKVQNVKNEQENVSNNHKKSSQKVVKVIVLLVLLGIIIYFAYSKYFKAENNDNSNNNASSSEEITVKTDWGNRYFVILKNSIEKPQDGFGIPSNAKNVKMRFLKIPTIKYPIMIINYVADDIEHLQISFIDSNNETLSSNFKGKTVNVEYLYNLEKKKYDWYIHWQQDDGHMYGLVTEYLHNALKEGENVDSQNVTNSEATNNTVFETTSYFIKNEEYATRYNQLFTGQETNSSEGVDIDVNATKEELRDKMNSAIDLYQSENEPTESSNTEGTNDVIQAGDFTLQCGVYEFKTSASDYLPTSYTINKDGTFSYKKEWDDITGAKYVDTGSGKYTISLSTYNKSIGIISFDFDKYNSTNSQLNNYDLNKYDGTYSVSSNNNFNNEQENGEYYYKGPAEEDNTSQATSNKISSDEAVKIVNEKILNKGNKNNTSSDTDLNVVASYGNKIIKDEEGTEYYVIGLYVQNEVTTSFVQIDFISTDGTKYKEVYTPTNYTNNQVVTKFDKSGNIADL